MKRTALFAFLSLICLSAVLCSCSKARLKPAVLEFKHVTDVQNKYHPHAKYAIHTDGYFEFLDSKGKPVKQEYVMKQSKLIMTGMDVKPTAYVASYQQKLIICIEFTESGRRKFADFTTENVGETLAIILNGRILTAPMVSGPVPDGRAVINGEFTQAEAQELAGLINSAANQREKPGLSVRLFRSYRDFMLRMVHR